MTRHGDLSVTATAPYFEQWVRNEAVGGGIAVNTTHYYTIGSFTLPWPGYAFAEMEVMVSIDSVNVQYFWADLQSSTPTPANYFTVNRHAMNDYTNWLGSLPLFARWDLPAVQTVTVGLRLGTGGGSPGRIFRVTGSIRGFPR